MARAVRGRAGEGRAVLVLDEGTTGVGAMVVDAAGQVVAKADQEFPQSYPRPGWVEQDPLQILATAKAALARARREAQRGPVAGTPAALGITNQRETTVVWDRRTGTPVHPAIVWQDRRTAATCAKLRPEWDAVVRRRTGLVLDPYFSATKLAWILDQKGVRRRAKAGELLFGTIDTWLAWNLTANQAHVTDPTNASRTMLYDIRKGAWDGELLDLFGVPEGMLPEVVPSAHAIGHTRDGVDVTALVGDQQAALFGQGCTNPGEAKATYGTGCFLLQHTGAKAVRSRHGLITTRAADLGGAPQYALEGSVFTGGAAFQWLRDELGLVDRASDVDVLAASVDHTGGVVVVPAFTGLGAPHWDPLARGTILGLTRGTTKAHLARAVLESVAHQCADVATAMEKDSGRRIPRLQVDGGASQSQPLLQAQADLLRRPVARPPNIETTSMGAAYLAGIAAGTWSRADTRELARGHGSHIVRPLLPPAAARDSARRWHAAVAVARSFPASVA